VGALVILVGDPAIGQVVAAVVVHKHRSLEVPLGDVNQH
jgi:hypothetical protein